MNIILINKRYFPWIGGVESHVKQIANGLVHYGIKPRVICCHTTPNTEHQQVDGISVLRYGSRKTLFSLPISLPFLLKFIPKPWQSPRPILHFHLPNPLAVLAYFIHRPHGLVVVTWHSDIIKQRILLWAYRPLLRWFLKRADAIIATSPPMAKLSPFLIPHQKKTTVIPLGIPPRPPAGLTKLPSERYALFVGRLVYYKGVETLIEALKQSPATVYIVGEGPQLDAIQKKGRTLIHHQQLRIYNQQSESKLHDLFDHCEFLILPSTHASEAFGLVQLEAMMRRKAVISTQLPTGVPYVNQHNQTGLVVPPGDSVALAKAMTQLWKNPQQCQQFGARAHQRYMDHFTEEQMLAKTYHLFNNLHTASPI